MISWNQKDFLLAIILQLDLFHHQLWLVSGFITKAYLSQWAAVGDKEEKLPELAGLRSGNNLNCLSACLALTLERKRLRETQMGPCPPHCLFSSGPATQASESCALQVTPVWKCGLWAESPEGLSLPRSGKTWNWETRRWRRKISWWRGGGFLWSAF